MQRVVRRVGFPLKSLSNNFPTRRISIKRFRAAGSESSHQIPRGQDTTWLLASTALLSAISGYLLATYGSQRPREMEEPHASTSQYDPPYGTAKDFREAIKELKEKFPKPGAVSDDHEVLEPYGFSENDYHPGAPLCRRCHPALKLGCLASSHTVVVRPESTEDVAKIVKIAVKYRMPVTPYSGGTSLEGNFRAVRGIQQLQVLCNS